MGADAGEASIVTERLTLTALTVDDADEMVTVLASGAVGTVQTTVSTMPDGRQAADVAWVIGVAWQGNRFATEAARALVDWLHGHGIDDVTAHIHPDHHASATVARRAGLGLTDEQRDGQTVWRQRDRR